MRLDCKERKRSSTTNGEGWCNVNKSWLYDSMVLIILIISLTLTRYLWIYPINNVCNTSLIITFRHSFIIDIVAEHLFLSGSLIRWLQISLACAPNAPLKSTVQPTIPLQSLV